jgi:hypothetical protein
MNQPLRAGVSAIAALWLLTVSLGSPARAADPVPSPAAKPKEARVTNHASGPFDVKVTPQATGDSAVGRMTLDKQFHGDLEGTSKGEMLTGMTAVQGSAGYVAIEQVTGTLKGRKGTFLLQHHATMNRGTPQLAIVVVPDSGTGELAGLAGTMNIVIAEGGKHSYDFEYTLPAS